MKKFAPLLFFLAASIFAPFGGTGAFAQEPGMALIPGFQNQIQTNNEAIPPLLLEFSQAARFYRVNFEWKFIQIERIKFTPGTLKFMGRVSNDQTQIFLNRELLKYPNLLRVVFFNQLGEIYNLEEKENGRSIMSKEWKINATNESHAYQLRIRGQQKKEFFRALEKQNPIKKRL